MPGTGATGGILKPKHFLISTGWRFARSRLFFDGPHIDHDLTKILRPVRYGNLLDLTGIYQFTPRLSLAVTLPVVLNRFSLNLPPAGNQRITEKAAGLADMSVIGRSWLLNPEKHSDQNISLGIGLKIPTGNWKLKNTFPDLSGANFIGKPVFASIMPGDGGVALIVETQGFKSFKFPVRSTNVFASASYLMNMRDTNRTASLITTLGAITPLVQNALVNSVPDAYSLLAGVSCPIPKVESKYLRGLRFTSAIRFEGSPPTDFLGRSNGFRQVGYFLAVEPGCVFAYRKYVVSISVPISFVRDGGANTTQLPGAQPFRTFATLAPVSFQLRLTRQF